MTRSQLVFGLGFVALGSVLLLDRADVVDAGTVLSEWWPSIVLVLGLSLLLQRPRHVTGGIFVTVMGAALLLWTLTGRDTVSLLWPLVLVGIGLVLLVRRPSTPPEANIVTDDDLVALFDDRVVRVAPAEELAGRSITTILGDVSLDLRDAVVGRRTTLEVVTILGDVELIVPDDWMVTTSGPQIFGSVRIAPPPAAGATRDGLHLEVVTVFGDVSVRRAGTIRQEQTHGAGPAS